MGSIVGFTLFRGLKQNAVQKLLAAQKDVLSCFEQLERKSISLGLTQLEFWGHREIAERIHRMPDGSILAIIGSPHGKTVWTNVLDELLANKFSLPWDGRVIVLQVSGDGSQWTMWNDWLGSIPVFHAEVGTGRIASTLEPVTVAAAGYSPDDFFMPGLVSLLINGHFISDWTLYEGMKVIPPDSKSEWGEGGFRSCRLQTVEPSASRWEAGWDDLVDEMHELSHKAIAEVLKTQPSWILPLSSGLDSRLIAGVAADIGANVHTYAWGGQNTTDVVFSRQIAETLGYPWKHIDLPKDFLLKYTGTWAKLFGSGLHFHGMYLMSFLDGLKHEPSGPVLSGFIGDTLAGDGVSDLSELHHSRDVVDQVEGDWYVFWKSDELRSLLKFSIDEAIEANVDEIRKLMDQVPGAYFQKLQFLELWGRERQFIPFQSTLMDYWRGVANPYMNRDYARFCLSIPRAVLDERRLQGDVFRKYYGRLAVIPGTYHKEPFILTGRYLLKRFVARHMPESLRGRFSVVFDHVPLRMDVESMRVSGRDALWPLFEMKNELSKWLNFDRLERDFKTIITDHEDIRPLRRLQSVQTLAYRLSNRNNI